MGSNEIPRKIVFKDNKSFFEDQCEFGETEIKVGKKTIVAIVLDGCKEFDTQNPVVIEHDGSQKAVLKVASNDGGFIVVAKTASGIGDRLKPDDLVLWLPLGYVEGLNTCEGIDERFGYAGIITAKINNEIDPQNSSFVSLSSYTNKASFGALVGNFEKSGQRIFGFLSFMLAFYLLILAIVEPKIYSKFFRDIEWEDWRSVFFDHAILYLLIVFVLSVGATIFWKEIFGYFSKSSKN